MSTASGAACYSFLTLLEDLRLTLNSREEGPCSRDEEP